MFITAVYKSAHHTRLIIIVINIDVIACRLELHAYMHARCIYGLSSISNIILYVPNAYIIASCMHAVCRKVATKKLTIKVYNSCESSIHCK